MRHPCERWGRQADLQRFVFLSVREALNAPAHPDSKRQEKRKRRDLEWYGARLLKQEHIISCPDQGNAKRDCKRETKRIAARFRQEQKMVAYIIARRLNGKEVTPTMHKYLTERIGQSYAA